MRETQFRFLGNWPATRRRGEHMTRKTDRAPIREWNLGPSILSVLNSAPDPSTIELPDEDHSPGTLHWGRGSMDGVMSHHFGSKKSKRAVKSIVAALQKLLGKDTAANREKLYVRMRISEVVGNVDDLLHALRLLPLHRHDVAEHARWLCREAAHREVVKLAIALLGEYGEPSDMPTLLQLARHDEFGLFSSVAIVKLAEDPREPLWEIARNAKGWGRIQAVERLAPIVEDNEDIQEWLLREGFRNDIMDEYLAYTCAVYGKLEAALARTDVDESFIDAAAGLTTSLFIGGPAEDIHDYEPGARVIPRLLSLVETRPETLARAQWVARVRSFVQGEKPERRREQGWTRNLDDELLRRCGQYLSRRTLHWLIDDAVRSGGQNALCDAWLLAPDIGADLWDVMFDRLQTAAPDSYFVQELLGRSTPARAQQLLNWAESLRLHEMEGPPEAGVSWRSTEPGSSVESLVQWMPARVPLSVKLVRACLRSSPLRLRYLGMAALKESPRELWWPLAESMIRDALKIEPDGDAKKRLKCLISGDYRKWE
jgi:hypothetical protein